MYICACSHYMIQELPSFELQNSKCGLLSIICFDLRIFIFYETSVLKPDKFEYNVSEMWLSCSELITAKRMVAGVQFHKGVARSACFFQTSIRDLANAVSYFHCEMSTGYHLAYFPCLCPYVAVPPNCYSLLQ